MCGIGGWQVNKDVAGDPRMTVLLTILGLEMDSRGGHSYGYWADGKMEKGLGHFIGNVNLPRVSEAGFMLFHCRWATSGGITSPNSHPFVEKGTSTTIMGCHNGIVYNHRDLNSKYHRGFDVDSQHIFKHLADDLDLS